MASTDSGRSSDPRRSGHTAARPGPGSVGGLNLPATEMDAVVENVPPFDPHDESRRSRFLGVTLHFDVDGHVPW